MTADATTPGPYAAAARAYLAIGWWPLPLPTRRKAPVPEGYTGAAGAAPTRDDVDAWITARADGNIAVRLAPDIIGLDVDAYPGKPGAQTLDDLECELGELPATVIVTSRDDGVSGIRLYRMPPGHTTEGMRTGWPGIEVIRHGHRYAVAPPSIHPDTGAAYRAEDHRTGELLPYLPHPSLLPVLPDPWVHACRKPAPAPREQPEPRLPHLGPIDGPWCRAVDDRLGDALADCAGASGSRHDATTAHVAALARLDDQGHRGVDAALDRLAPAFIAAITPDRPGGADEARREWRSIVATARTFVDANPTPANLRGCCGADARDELRRGDAATLADLIAHPAAPPATPSYAEPAPPYDGPQHAHGNPEAATSYADPTTPEQAADDASGDEAPARTSWWPADPHAVLTGQHADPPPAALARVDTHRLWYAGRVNGLIGESESGKTWIALEAVRQELTAGHHVAYLDFEDTLPGVVRRLRDLGCLDEHLARLAYISPDEGLHIAAQADLAEAITTHRPTLVVIDGVNAAMTLLGLDLNSNTDATTFAMRLLKPLTASGAAVAYIDHVPKSREGRGKGGIGAQAKRAMTTGCTIAVDVTRAFGRGQTGRLRLTVDKDRPGHVRGLCHPGTDFLGMAVLVSDADTGAVTVRLQAPAAAGETTAPFRPTALMQRVSGFLASLPDGASVTQIETQVEGKAVYIRKALDCLANEGYVTRSNGPRGSVIHKHVRAYYEAHDLIDDDEDD